MICVMRIAFTISTTKDLGDLSDHLVPIDITHPRRQKKMVRGLPTTGVYCPTKKGVFLYWDDTKGGITMICYNSSRSVVTVVGGSDEDKRAWKNYIKAQHGRGARKRGRPRVVKLTREEQLKRERYRLIETLSRVLRKLHVERLEAEAIKKRAPNWKPPKE
jgi:hypothetical protein